MIDRVAVLLLAEMRRSGAVLLGEFGISVIPGFVRSRR
jgi:hypothetical protein